MAGKPKKRHSVTQPLDKPYRFIALTQGQNAIVDVQDFSWLSQWNWHARWNERTRSFYAVRREGRQQLRMHRVIIGCKNADHKNHDTLDNRKENLRKCTVAQNARNKRMRILGVSGFKGVGKHKSKWQARICLNYKPIFLGLFNSPVEAAHAYDVAARKYHGAFAHLNFPGPC